MTKGIAFRQNDSPTQFKNIAGLPLLAMTFALNNPICANPPADIIENGIVFNINDPNPVINRIEVSRLERRLNNLVELYSDEEDVVPISQLAINNIRTLLLTENNSLLCGWNIFSNDKGALTLEYQRREKALATICISDSQISYHVEKHNEMQVYGIEPFSKEAVCSLLQKVI